MQKHLKLEAPPRRIECFDISTVQGAFSVGSMVVFIGGKADKKSYRHFTIKHTLEITGGTEPNDFEMMREVLRRRLQRALEGDEKFLPLPDLLMVDGGKGQLGIAVAVLQEKTLEFIPVSRFSQAARTAFRAGPQRSYRFAAQFSCACICCNASATKRTVSPSRITANGAAKRPLIRY